MAPNGASVLMPLGCDFKNESDNSVTTVREGIENRKNFPEALLSIDGRSPAESRHNHCGSTVYPNRLSENAPSITDEERSRLSKYQFFSSECMLAELKEAFLMFAAEPGVRDVETADDPSMIQPRLNSSAFGCCLRAIGQNPTEADIAEMVRICSRRKASRETLSHSRQPAAADGPVTVTDGNGPAPRETKVNESSLGTGTEPGQSSVTPAGRLQSIVNTGTSSRRHNSSTMTTPRKSSVTAKNTKRKQSKRLSSMSAIFETAEHSASPHSPTPWQLASIEIDDFLYAVSAVLGENGRFRSEAAQAADLESAFGVFDCQLDGMIDARQLQSAVTTLGEPISRADFEALIEGALHDGGKLNSRRLIEKLTGM